MAHPERIELAIHVELADTETGVSWWCESPALPGFYGAADSLPELRTLVYDHLVGEHLVVG
jgi:hypothetical protein